MTDPHAPSPERLLADGFARHVALWSRAAGAAADATSAVAHAAHALSIACSGGDVCIDLSAVDPHPDWPCDPDAQRAALAGSGVVGSAETPGAMPLVLDGDRLYLHRYFDYERRLADRLAELHRALPSLGGAEPRLRTLISELFGAVAPERADEVDWQRLAVAMALAQRLVVVSGGPGTGKTTTVVNLLACLLALDPHIRIVLAAPTGKAAGRMTEAIRRGATGLPEALRALLPAEASTVHRLLGVRGDGSFAHHANHPLAVDVLIVDEASMLDLALATQLLEAVPLSARVVLLGDKDQLAAVESGAVFSDLCADPALSSSCRHRLAALSATPEALIVPPDGGTQAGLSDAAVWFTRNFRFARESGIGRLATMINAGEGARLPAWLRMAQDPAVRWLEDDGQAPEDRVLLAACDGYAAYVDTVARRGAHPAEVADAFARYRVLCAVREGPNGVEALNAALTEALRRRLPSGGHREGAGWFVGRPVMIRRNDYLLKLFNGDIGIALPADTGALTVWFPDGSGGYRGVSPARLPEHETAFAMTVHKSQGSEFASVLVVLPARHNRVLTRELLYTGVTRARERVTIAGPEGVLRAAVEARTRRRSGLALRLAQALERPQPRDSSG